MAPCWTVYCHTHTASNRSYVGITKKTMMERWNQHVYSSLNRPEGKKSHLWAAIRLYGKEAFSHEILETCDTLEAANAAEERWIEKLGTRDMTRGFNLTRGGLHVPHPIRNPWEDISYREKSLSILLKRNRDPRIRASISAKLTGRTLSPEHVSKVKVSTSARQAEFSALGNAAKRASPKTHCKHGHSLADAFLKRGGKSRACRTCDHERNTERRKEPAFRERQKTYNSRRNKNVPG